MNIETQTAKHRVLEYGSIFIAKSSLLPGVTPIKPREERYGRNLHLLFPIDGELIVRSSPGSQDLVGSSDMAWLTNWSPYSLYAANPCRTVSVFVPERILSESADPNYQFPIVASRELSLRNPVREFVRSLTDDGAPTDRLPAYLVEKLILEMALSLLLETQGMQKISASSSVEQSLYARAMAYIAAYKTDPDLTPARVASTMNISLRQLQRAFAAHETSVNEEIRQHRVDTAVGLLSDPTYRHLDLGQIAHYAGFGGRADLRRAIAAVHGVTPTQLRVSA